MLITIRLPKAPSRSELFSEVLDYDTAADSTVKERKRKTFEDQEEEQDEAGTFTNGGTSHKRFKQEVEEAPETPKEGHKKKKIKMEEMEQTEADQETTEQTPKEKHRKKKKVSPLFADFI